MFMFNCYFLDVQFWLLTNHSLNRSVHNDSTRLVEPFQFWIKTHFQKIYHVFIYLVTRYTKIVSLLIYQCKQSGAHLMLYYLLFSTDDLLRSDILSRICLQNVEINGWRLIDRWCGCNRLGVQKSIHWNNSKLWIQLHRLWNYSFIRIFSLFGIMIKSEFYSVKMNK